MKVEVGFLARDLETRAEGKTVIVVDVQRASTTIITMFDKGAARVMVGETPDRARALKQQSDGPCLLVGEVGGLPPADFDYGNSPVQMREVDLSGQAVAFSSSNGAKALSRVSRAGRVFVGAFANAGAVVEKALADARQHGRDLAIVASGEELGTHYALEDLVCCGYLVDRLLKRVAEMAGVDRGPLGYPPGQRPHRYVGDVYLDDTAFIALRLSRSYGGDIPRAFAEAQHTWALLDLGLEADVHYCAEVDVSRAVPELQVQPDGRLVLE